MIKIQYATISETDSTGDSHCPALPTFRAMANKKSAENFVVCNLLLNFALK